MNWIEILGPSGIGKTYLKNKLLSSEEKLGIFSIEDALKEVAIGNTVLGSTPGAVNKILGLYLRQNIIHSKRAMIIENLLDYKKGYLSNAYKYTYLLGANISYYYKSEIPVEEKVYRISLFKSIIEKITALDYYHFKDTVLFDEGPFNHSHQLKSSLIGKKSVLPEAFIFCDASPKVIFNRVKKRAKEGRIVPAHQNLSEEELYQHILTRYNAYLNRMEEFKKFNVPYIQVSLEGDIDLVLENVRNFFQENKIPEYKYEK